MGERDRLEVDLDTFAAALDAGAPVVDVRRPDEFVEAHVPGARLIPLEELGERLHEIPRDQRVYVICAVGGRSLAAAEALASAGWDAVSVAGGTIRWAEEGRPVLTGLR
ncbi:MAG TPA: rhodanese-like domain-containing protein [Acidimicrobiales bacterium]|nr:rhodanese-like domain-containing protein [Acidimicrobiales bacterium]